MINKTKLVATAMATFVSTDKFIIMAAIRCPRFDFPFAGWLEFRRVYGCQAQREV
jgi:hypothetical protein